MAYKADNSTVSLLPEATWGVAPVDYSLGRILQNNEGSFGLARNALESEARTANAELGGVRLGNTNVSGNFMVEFDPCNYEHLVESLFYSTFSVATGTITLDGVDQVSVSSASNYTLDIPFTPANMTTLGDLAIGDPVRLSGISDAGLVGLEGICTIVAVSPTILTILVPTQHDASVPSTATDLTLSEVQMMRPAKTRSSFNAEETLFHENGTDIARFMTVGAVVSSADFELPSEGNIKSTFSFIGSGKKPSAEYTDYDSNLTNGQAAHTNPTPHDVRSPLVLQDGAIISATSDIRCVWMSGNITVENGTEPFYTGCSFDAQGVNSGKFRVNVSYEALFGSEQDFIDFQNETSHQIMVRLKDRLTEESFTIFLPSFKMTGYEINNSTGLVTASVTGVAEVDETTVNSIVVGRYIV